MDDFDGGYDDEIEDDIPDQGPGESISDKYDNAKNKYEDMKSFKQKLDNKRNGSKTPSTQGTGAKNAANQGAKKANSEVGKQVAKEGTKKVGEEAGKQAGKQVAKKAGEEVGKQAAKKAATHAAAAGATATGVGAPVGALIEAASIAKDVADKVGEKVDEQLADATGIDAKTIKKVKKVAKYTWPLIIILVIVFFIIIIPIISTQYVLSEEISSNVKELIKRREKRYDKELLFFTDDEIKETIKKDFDMDSENAENKDPCLKTILKAFNNDLDSTLLSQEDVKNKNQDEINELILDNARKYLEAEISNFNKVNWTLYSLNGAYNYSVNSTFGSLSEYQNDKISVKSTSLSKEKLDATEKLADTQLKIPNFSTYLVDGVASSGAEETATKFIKNNISQHLQKWIVPYSMIIDTQDKKFVNDHVMGEMYHKINVALLSLNQETKVSNFTYYKKAISYIEEEYYVEEMINLPSDKPGVKVKRRIRTITKDRNTDLNTRDYKIGTTDLGTTATSEKYDGYTVYVKRTKHIELDPSGMPAEENGQFMVKSVTVNRSFAPYKSVPKLTTVENFYEVIKEKWKIDPIDENKAPNSRSESGYSPGGDELTCTNTVTETWQEQLSSDGNKEIKPYTVSYYAEEDIEKLGRKVSRVEWAQDWGNIKGGKGSSKGGSLDKLVEKAKEMGQNRKILYRQSGRQFAETEEELDAMERTDCSAYVNSMYKTFLGIDVSSNTETIYAKGMDGYEENGWTATCEAISGDASNIEPGDILYRYGHVAIYAGDNVVVSQGGPGEVNSESDPGWVGPTLDSNPSSYTHYIRYSNPNDTSDGIQANGELSRDMSPQEYIDFLAPYAVNSMSKSGILASVTMAQAIVEGGWANKLSDLAIEYNNLFGIKASEAWSGPTVIMNTREEDSSGNSYWVDAEWRVYDSVGGAFDDRCDFLWNNMNYKECTEIVANNERNANGHYDYRKAVQIIKDNGYATDGNYVNIICGVIEDNQLWQYDDDPAGAWDGNPPVFDGTYQEDTSGMPAYDKRKTNPIYPSKTKKQKKETFEKYGEGKGYSYDDMYFAYDQIEKYYEEINKKAAGGKNTASGMFGRYAMLLKMLEFFEGSTTESDGKYLVENIGDGVRTVGAGVTLENNASYFADEGVNIADYPVGSWMDKTLVDKVKYKILEAKYIPTAEAAAAGFNLEPWQIDALICRVYNTGNASGFPAAYQQYGNEQGLFDAYMSSPITDAAGNVYPGLVTRRAAEWKLFHEGIYAFGDVYVDARTVNYSGGFGQDYPDSGDGYSQVYQNTKTGNRFKEYKQDGSGSYTGNPSGWGGNIAYEGCMVTAISIAATGFGVDMDPGQVNEINKSSGMNVANTLSIVLPNQRTTGAFAYISQEELVENLKNGGAALLWSNGGSSFTSSTHFMTILDVSDDGSQVYLSNPASRGTNGWIDIGLVYQGLNGIDLIYP